MHMTKYQELPRDPFWSILLSTIINDMDVNRSYKNGHTSKKKLEVDLTTTNQI